MRRSALILLAGCIETGVTPADEKPFSDPPPTDSGAGPDTAITGDTAPPDTAPAVECPEEVPADVTVATDAACTVDPGPVSLELVEAWRWTGPGLVSGVHAGRSIDANGDGVVDASDPMQLWVEYTEPTGPYHQVSVFDGTGALLAEPSVGAYCAGVLPAELDATRLGAEAFVTDWVYRADRSVAAVYDESGRLAASSYAAVASHCRVPYLIRADSGDPLVAVSSLLMDARTGVVVGGLEGADEEHRVGVAAGDLDRDGLVELVAAQYYPDSVSIHTTDGARLATLLAAKENQLIALALGELDGDPDGEALVVRGGTLAVFDADGSLVREANGGTASPYPHMAGIAELDGDPLPELVVSWHSTVMAYDDDLRPKWTWTHPTTPGYTLFSVADLDADGVHEVLLDTVGSLVVLAGSGAELARLGEPGVCTVTAQPIVADVDADGLVEVVVARCDGMSLVENVDGGWLVADGSRPWPGPGMHPEWESADGTVLPPTDWWNEPGANVWQGLPHGPPTLADLAAEITDVCAECGGDALVAVRVSNPGTDDLDDDVTVVLTATATGEELARTVIAGPLGAGVGRHVVLTVPADRLDEGLTATVSTDAPLCARSTPVARWDDAVCP